MIKYQTLNSENNCLIFGVILLFFLFDCGEHWGWLASGGKERRVSPLSPAPPHFMCTFSLFTSHTESLEQANQYHTESMHSTY